MLGRDNRHVAFAGESGKETKGLRQGLFIALPYFWHAYKTASGPVVLPLFT